MSFDSLPDEISQEIFMKCVQEAPKRLNLYARGALLMVCKRWSELALSYPPLWSTIFVRIFFEQEDQYDKYLPALPTVSRWIERSGSFPLTFSLEIDGRAYQPWFLRDDHDSEEDEIESRALINRALDLFLPHRLRWRNVTLIDEQGTLLPGLSQRTAYAPNVEYPELESLSIQGISWRVLEAGEDSKALLGLLSHSPRLRDVTLHFASAYHKDFHPLQVLRKLEGSIPWHQLTRLECNQGIHSSRVLRWLQNCPHLNWMSAVINPNIIFPLDPGYSPLPDDFHVFHDHLEELVLSTPYNTTPLLDFITTPNLHTLSFRFLASRDADEEQNATALANLLRRSRARIMKFSFLGRNYSSETVTRYLRVISPTVQELRLASRLDTALQLLTVEHPSQQSVDPIDHVHNVLCPQLHTLTLRRYDRTNAIEKYYISQMVKSRWDLPHKSESTLGVVVAGIEAVDVRSESMGPQGIEHLQADLDRINMLSQEYGRRIRVFWNGREHVSSA